MTKIEQTQLFAHIAHDSVKQVRKYTGEPYWVHTDEVARIVAEDGGDEDMVCAAHLHDVIEDVFPIAPTFDIMLIAKYFGNDVARLVTELTDVYTKVAWPDLNREKRHNLERERLSRISAAAKTIKLADLLSNTKSIVAEDKDFAQVYIREKIALLPYLSEGSSRLLQQTTSQTIAACLDLGIDMPMFKRP